MSLRVLIHAHSLSGAGHYVRARALAAELARVHDVTMVDAGKLLPLPLPAKVKRVQVDRIRREGCELVSADDGVSTDDVLARRRVQLAETAASFRADVLVIEHYPFSKWQLAEEVESLIEAARTANPRVRVVCSVRDLPLQTRYEACTPEDWAGRVVDTLNRHFDALLVHADPRLTPFEPVFPAVSRLRIPFHLTGLVHHVEEDSAGAMPAAIGDRPFVLCSIGGGSDGADLLATCRAAWRALRVEDPQTPSLLVTCGGAYAGATREDDILELPFTTGFGALLRASRLSISHAGYNTCADLLRYRTPAVLVAHPSMSDQAARAAVMDRIGAARSLDPARLDVGVLAAVMRRQLRDPSRCALAPALDGAQVACAWIEDMTAGR